MAKPDHHPTREELLQALTAGTNPFENHLKKCKACRAEWEMLKLAYPEGVVPQTEAPSEAHLAALEAIAVLKSDRRRAAVTGELAYDSWSGLSSMQVRDAARGFERRLRLRAGRIELEIVAERELTGWKFSARAYIDKVPSGGFALKVGRKTLTPEFRNCFYWSSERPPKTMRLLSASEEIVFRAIPWPGK